MIVTVRYVVAERKNMLLFFFFFRRKKAYKCMYAYVPKIWYALEIRQKKTATTTQRRSRRVEKVGVQKDWLMLIWETKKKMKHNPREVKNQQCQKIEEKTKHTHSTVLQCWEQGTHRCGERTYNNRKSPKPIRCVFISFASFRHFNCALWNKFAIYKSKPQDAFISHQCECIIFNSRFFSFFLVFFIIVIQLLMVIFHVFAFVFFCILSFLLLYEYSHVVIYHNYSIQTTMCDIFWYYLYNYRDMNALIY